MHRAALGEWLLALVAPPEFAASTVGDLLEDGRGLLSFWTAMARTAASLVWRDFTEATLPLAGVAVMAWFGYLLSMVLVFILAGPVMAVMWATVEFLTGHTGFELLNDIPGVSFPPSPGNWVLTGANLLFGWVVLPFHAGRFAALCSPRREMAAWLMVAIVWPPMSILTKAPLTVVPVLFAIFGAIATRRQMLRVKAS